MFLMQELREYPDGSDILMSLLNKFKALEEEQIIIYFTQTDKAFNRARVEKMFETLIKMNVIIRSDEYISLKDNEDVDPDVVDAFWALLHYLDKDTSFDAANYPAEIVFMKDDEVHEIIIMDDENMEKMDYMSKRKPRKNKCHYDFLFTSGTIDAFDDELFQDIGITLITMTDRTKGIPKLTYHEVETL